ncbi:MAG: hypothetical protein E6L08_11130 [Verrucomicrobia bacterium]|nr:MAG: hypothetical protein E6L08_11130 [Verrucomicrobiota bacterium]
MKNRLFIVVSVLLAGITITPAFGKGRKKKTTPAPVYHAPVISNATGNAITVSDQKTTRTFTITRFTEINVNGQRATTADLKPGMTVNVTIAMDPSCASRIVATGLPAKETQKSGPGKENIPR